MKNLISFCTLSFLITNLSLFGGNPLLPETQQNKETPKICFTENKGQVYDQNYKPRPDVLYGAMAGNMAVHIKNTGVSYQLYRVDKWKEVTDPKTKQNHKEIDQQTIYRVDLYWLNTNKNFTKSEDEALPGYNNYYLESCSNGALNVKSYKGINLNNLYQGINLHYYEKNGELKHDYIVAPHADYKQIMIKVEGAEISLNNDGSLLLSTPLGKIQEGAPIVYQNGRQLKAKWEIGNNTLSFEIENYNSNYELIIDPITRLWGTYYGEFGNEFSGTCTVDATGNVYLPGSTQANTSTVIATAGAHQFVLGGSTDAFIVKFNGAGQRLWGTYYGGTGDDGGGSSSTDLLGNVYMAGNTKSNAANVIATIGSHQLTHGGGASYDAFLVKFDSNGQRLWGTYYGGLGNDGGYCNTDASGNVYLTGQTGSSTSSLIATAGSHQSTLGGTYDAFLVKFNSSGQRQWGTYYGGVGNEGGSSCSTDASGNVYFAGTTDFDTGTVIATSGSHLSIYGGGIHDAFLIKFNAAGQRQWGTYYGGSGNDVGWSCATDAFGNVYLSGGSDSNTVSGDIATPGSHQSAYGGGAFDAFLIKFNSAGQRQWGTYYGGAGGEGVPKCNIDVFGNVYLVGNTGSNTGTVIATNGSHQSVYGGGNQDAFLVKFRSSGQRLWGTYYGGTGNDLGSFCSIDASGNIYLSGYTQSSTGTTIATFGSHQSTTVGGWDAFLVKFLDSTTVTSVTEEQLGINSLSIKIYPNPNNGLVNVESQIEAQVLIIDLQGRIVSNLSLVSGKNQISIEHLENGVYFLELSHPQGKEVFRIIKQ